MNRINRRSLLSWLGASTAAALSPLSAFSATGPSQPQGVLSLESFRLIQPDHVAALHDYFAGTLLPLMDRVHTGAKLVLEAVVAPHTPQALFLSAFSGFDQMLEVRARMAADPAARQARADLESAHVGVLDQIHSQVLLTSAGAAPARFASFGEEGTLFELRSYHAPGWQDSPPALVAAIFQRAGIRPAFRASSGVGEHLPRFTHLIPFASLAEREQAWARLEADPEWKAVQQDSIDTHGYAVKVTEKSIYKLAPYSRWA